MSAADEALRAALNLARNTGWHVFPAGPNKHPTRPKAEGGRGYQDASADPDEIGWLWLHWPGPHVAVATGAVSGFDVLDVDNKHLPDDAKAEQIATRDAAAWWWLDHHLRITRTRAFSSQRGGIHLYFTHAPGLRSSTARVNRGVDVRADGGYIVYWYASGFRCLDHTPITGWPAWLLTAATKPEPKPEIMRRYDGPGTDAINGIVRHLETAPAGERNSILFWCACRLAERGVSQAEAESLLLPAVPKHNDPPKDRSTIASAFRTIWRAA